MGNISTNWGIIKDIGRILQGIALLVYVIISGIILHMFVKRIRKLNLQNEYIKAQQISLEKVVTRYTLVGIIQYVSSLFIMLLVIIDVILPTQPEWLRIVYNIIWNAGIYVDIILNIICLYFQYNVGENDYYKWCKYCDYKCFRSNSDTFKGNESNDLPTLSPTASKVSQSPAVSPT